MERLNKSIFCLVFLFFGSEFLIEGQIPSLNVTGHVIAEIIPVYSATEIAQLNFGRFSPGPQGGEIILTPESTVSVNGNIHTSAGFYNAASFYLSGDPNASFTISLPDEPVVLKHAISAKTIVVSNWMSSPGSGMGAGILNNGEKVVFIGATLKVGPLEDNPIGVYAGTYTVTFDFN